MRKILFLCLSFSLLSIMLISCGSAKEITNRDKVEKKSAKKVNVKNIKENFVITPYRTKIDVKPKSNSDRNSHLNIWYNYSNNTITDTSNVIERVNGFRVQILSTDNLEHARKTKERILPKINQKQVYILFDPPFYKVQVGDFTVNSLAEDLEFKLKQLGYNNARIVREKVNQHP